MSKNADQPEGAGLSLGPMEGRLGMRLRFAQAQVFRELGETFAPYDITPLLFSILALIEANPGCRQSDLGALLGVKAPNMVERVGVLVGRGLVSRAPDTRDRRANILLLTEAGRALLAELKAADDRTSAALVERLGAEDHARLVALLRRLAPSDARSLP